MRKSVRRLEELLNLGQVIFFAVVQHRRQFVGAHLGLL